MESTKKDDTSDSFHKRDAIRIAHQKAVDQEAHAQAVKRKEEKRLNQEAIDRAAHKKAIKK